ncbi:hypothetical protein EI77_01628 [Prosthecobacter fusiformis]|uniref:histidine kinase n=1 Tax=Prosthecobacter fusiformis TaxID=48464 RepID=A0A4R7S426_9BACT|nr:ATP-binding protein [Prosthecobacter fusiformis]TDU73160.1 hypothetical protein EI77_01628 [Prosthecobacter fusiformis]
MLELSKLFDTTGFPPRWHCGSWSDFHGWVHVVSDLAIFGAYAAIPISITSYVMLKKQDVAFPRLYWLFAGFILSCGLTHLVEATLFWHPWYRFSGLMKVITAGVSWFTVVAMIRALPMAMTIPGAAKLNRQLSAEIVEHKRAEVALQAASARLALAMDHSGLGNWNWDAESDACYFSRRAAAIFGMPAETAIPWNQVLEHIHGEDREGVNEGLRKAVAQRAIFDCDFRFQRSGGTEVWVSAKGRAEDDGQGGPIHVSGIIADITERKTGDKIREELLVRESQARQEAEDANRMKDEFLAVLSHELRTPLNAILGWAGMLRASHMDEGELTEGLEVIERNTLAQAKLVEDLLDMSRIIAGKVRLDVQTVDLSAIINASIDAVRPQVETKNLNIVSILDPMAGPVRGDPARLQQVLWNLLTNAVKFTERGGKIEVALERVNSHVEITVSDNGVGIEPDFLPHVFDRFRQADSSMTRRHGGLGLGLAIVKNLVELHGGTINAKSGGRNRGTSFRIALPLPITHGGSHSATGIHPATVVPTELSEFENPDLTGIHILAVDDERDSLEMVRRLLENKGAEVTMASSGEEALEKLAKNPAFDLMISDIGMPVMNGYELITTIRGMKPNEGGQITAIALTAFARSEDRRRAMTAGFDTFLSKPVETNELLAVVHRCVTRHRQSGSVE